MKRLASGSDAARMRTCACCGVTSTPQWRRGPNGPNTLCNRCGCRFHGYSSYRPLTEGPLPTCASGNPRDQFDSDDDLDLHVAEAAASEGDSGDDFDDASVESEEDIEGPHASDADENDLTLQDILDDGPDTAPVEEVFARFQNEYSRLYPAQSNFLVLSALDRIAHLPFLVKRLKKCDWIAEAVQVVVWVASMSLAQGAQQTHAAPSWYSLGGPHCQIGKTVFAALLVAACDSMRLPCFVITYIAKSHVPDTCKKISKLLEQSQAGAPWIVVRCLNEGSGIKWWKFLGDNSHRVCWVGSFNSKYQLDTLTCMRARLQKMNLAPVIILDEADAALRSLFRTKECEKALDALLGMEGSEAAYLSRRKLMEISGAELPETDLRSIGGLVSVTSSPAGLMYYYIKHLKMTLADWCYPKVDPSWYCAVDTHYKPRILLDEDDLKQHSYRLLDKQGKVMQMLRKHARQGRNFVVICGNTKVGAPGGCRDALDYVLDDLEDNNLQGAAFVYTPSKSLYLAGPSFRKTGSTAWTLLTKELYNTQIAADEVRSAFPDYAQCCQLVRHLAGIWCVFTAGTIESIGRCISTVANYEEHGAKRLSLTTAVFCFPTPAKQLEAIIQAIQRATSSNAAAMANMGIDCIDFAGFKQDWEGTQAYLPHLQAMNDKWTESANTNSLEERTADLMNLIIHPSLDFLTKFNSSAKKRPWGQLKLVYKPVVRSYGRKCMRRTPVYRSAPVELSLKWEVLVKLYELSQQSSSGYVTRTLMLQQHPQLMQRVDSGNRHIISEFASPRRGGTPYLRYVEGQPQGTYELTTEGRVKAQEIVGDAP